MTTIMKNNGVTKFVIKENGRKKDEETIKWDIDYDGHEADIDVKIKNNKKKAKHLTYKLDNQDLVNLLNMNSVDNPLDTRLEEDFLKKNLLEDDRGVFSFPSQIEQPDTKIIMIVEKPQRLNITKLGKKSRHKKMKNKRRRTMKKRKNTQKRHH
jgi:hypothetical protein